MSGKKQDDLETIVWDRAQGDAVLSDEAKLLVLAAMQGDDSLSGALAGGTPAAPETEEAAAPVRAFLSSVTVEGLRGIGAPATLRLHPGPGLTVIAGRNGCGKTSFAEALEVALTRGSYRWNSRKGIGWHEAWRNIHQAEKTAVTVELAEEGKGLTTVSASWPAGAEFGESVAWVQRPGAKREQGLDALGWAADLELFRPFLSYDELGTLFAEPSKLYEALRAILGLERLDDATKALTAQHKRLGEPKDAASKAAKDLKASLEAMPDERAAKALKEIGKRTAPDLKAVAELVTGTGVTDTGELAALRALTSLTVPESDALLKAIDDYRTASAEWAKFQQNGDSGHARRADLLTQALALHEHDGDVTCPVCGGGTLDGDWAARITAELSDEAESARARGVAKQAIAAARSAIVALVQPVPRALAQAQGLDLGSDLPARLGEVAETWNEWVALDEAENVVADGEAAHALVREALARLRSAAGIEFDRRQDAWQPLAVRLGGWLGHAEQMEENKTHLARAKESLDWMKTHSGDSRTSACGRSPIARGRSGRCCDRRATSSSGTSPSPAPLPADGWS